MQTVIEDELKTNNYMPLLSPTVNGAYQNILREVKEIFRMVLLTTPTPELREYVNTNRNSLKEKVCKNCENLNQLKTITNDIKGFKREIISKEKNKVKVLLEECKLETSKKVMACEGCIALKIKQIATAYITGRRFKQVGPRLKRKKKK